MNIELLGFGNITVAALILSLAYLAITLVYQVGMVIGRFVLSLDHENAPDMLKENKLWNWAAPLVGQEAFLLMDSYGRARGALSMDWSDGYKRNWRTYCKGSETYRVRVAKGYTPVFAGHGLDWFLLGQVGVVMLGIDLAIFWLQCHFLSAVWVLSTVGVALSLRFITNKIWGHSGRITKLEEKDNV